METPDFYSDKFEMRKKYNNSQILSSPRNIYNYLDERVFGQEDYKKKEPKRVHPIDFWGRIYLFDSIYAFYLCLRTSFPVGNISPFSAALLTDPV